MSWKAALVSLGVLANPMTLFAAEPAPKPVEVMVVGVFHMSNPGRDLHDMKADDMLTPGRQAEIAALTAALARFKPTKVGVEASAETVEGSYRQYLEGTLPASRNEVVQLGFRLAQMAAADGVYNLDADGDFPYERLKNFAETRGFKGLLDEENAATDQDVAEEGRVLKEKGVAADLRLLNDPARIARANGFYRSMLHIGARSDQPGVDLLTVWYRRNFQICANLLQLAKPGDRMVVFFGAGHAYVLRQCVTETPGYRLIEPNDYLPT